jgi:hypothetical protein
MEKATRMITYDFVNIINDKLYAKSLYEQSYRHFLNKTSDEKYFVDILDNCKCFKLSKKYKKNNITVLPIHYNHDTDEFNKYKDLILDKFLTPILSKLMSIVFDDNFKIDFYNSFKYKYFIPILEAEYSRMTKEDLDYNNEKPFIICIESAISNFLNDKKYVNFISDKVLNKLKKSLKNFKFIPVTTSDTGANIIGKPLKLLDYFSTTYYISLKEQHKIECNEQILVNVTNTRADPTKDYYINLKTANFTLQRVLDYILRMCYIEIIRLRSISDVSVSFTDDIFENIKNELFIYNSRTAKVIKDYLIKFRSDYGHFFSLQTEQSSYKLITDMLANIESEEKHLYNDSNPNKKYLIKDPVSTSVTATTKLYTMISTIESMNRDYAKSNCFIVDVNSMHSVFEMISKNMKDIVELRNEFFSLIYMNPDIFLNKWYPDNKQFESYKKTENFFYHCVNLATMYGKVDTMSKENIVHHLVEEFRCLYFKDHQFNTNYDTVLFDKENGFDSSKYADFIEDVFSIIEKLSSDIKNISWLYLKNILLDIQHWSGIMENNVRYYQYFDSAKEFRYYNSHLYVSKEDFDFFTFEFFERT